MTTVPSLRARIVDRVRGFRTFAVAGFCGLLGALNVIGTVDLSPLVKVFVRDEAQIGLVLMLVAMAFALLRYWTSTPPGQSPAAGSAKSVDAGS